tara:strand:+ start:51 stop:287 length:237 start_codon:yes stop_codon:yes gene_type:complete
LPNVLDHAAAILKWEDKAAWSKKAKKANRAHDKKLETTATKISRLDMTVMRYNAAVQGLFWSGARKRVTEKQSLATAC